MLIRVARWFIFKPKIHIWALDWKMFQYFMENLEYCTNIWDIFWPSGTFSAHLLHFFPVLVSGTKNNLATLMPINFTSDHSLKF
jgi:hypothetical protein